MRSVFIPHEVAEFCFLDEAVKWAAFQRYPLSIQVENECDFRFDGDYQEEFEASSPIHDEIDDAECRRSGLPPNPFWEVPYEDHLEESVFFIEMEQKKATGQAWEALEKRRIAAELYRERLIEWSDSLESYLEIYRLKLCLALAEGKIKAQGRLARFVKQGSPKLSWKKDENLEEIEEWHRVPHTAIKPELWRYDCADWAHSTIYTPQGQFIHVVVDTDSLFKVFPEAEPEVAQISARGGQYVQSTTGSDLPKPPLTNRGRPPYDWDAFHIELTRAAFSKALPTKIEAATAHMQEWCAKTWGRTVSRSTIHPKVSRFIKEIGLSENSG